MSGHSFMSETKVNKVKKERVCRGCGRMFSAGQWLWKQVGVFEGYFFSDYMCNPCRKEMHTNEYTEGWAFGELKEGRLQKVRSYLERRKLRDKSGSVARTGKTFDFRNYYGNY